MGAPGKTRSFVSRNSENIAGIVSLAGSSALLVKGDAESMVSAALFTAAELTLARFGNRTGGYAAAAVLFAAGDANLAFSDYVVSGSPLQYSLLAMTAAWLVGASRYPLERHAKRTKSDRWQRVADGAQTFCGSANLALRLPAIVSGIAAREYVVAGAVTAWATADVLAGRLQERVSTAYRKVHG